MFPKALAPQLCGLSVSLLTALSVGLVLNLGALIFSLRILTRGTRDYSASYPIFPSHLLMTNPQQPTSAVTDLESSP